MLNVSWPVVEIRTLCSGEGETIFDLSRIILLHPLKVDVDSITETLKTSIIIIIIINWGNDLARFFGSHAFHKQNQ